MGQKLGLKNFSFYFPMSQKGYKLSIILQQKLRGFYCVFDHLRSLYQIFWHTKKWYEKKMEPIIMDKIITKKKINQVKLDKMEKTTHT